jgi:hypothetical protein
MKSDVYYTHAEWKVSEGREAEFLTAWQALSAAFASLAAKPLWGTLLASEREPGLFYSFGPWEKLEDIEAMRADPGARLAIDKVIALCDSATPGTFRLVAHVALKHGEPTAEIPDQQSRGQ